MSKNSIIKGTLILTVAGFITRIIGFFYRIYLSNVLGPENIGVYQLIFPVYGICFTLYAAGIQTSISRMIAAEIGKKDSSNLARILRTGLAFSVSIAIILSVLLYFNAEYVATHILLEPRSASSLRILSYVFPFCGITACINGYYYGIKKAGIPATTQLLEQIVRVIVVYTAAPLLVAADTSKSCEIAVWGIVIGEIASNLYNMISMIFVKPSKLSQTYELGISTLGRGLRNRGKEKAYAMSLLKLAIPLTSNRLLISILNSIESILIPTMLKSYGLSTSEALSVYGVLTGMALPFILFPSAITNSFSVLLLPTVSEAQAAENNRLINKTTTFSVKYSLIIGILSTGLFITFGNALGEKIFHNVSAGVFITILAWLCPFIYLTTTLGSIINGLGKPHISFFNTVTGLAIRILFVLLAIPKYGIWGYLVGALISQVVISCLDMFAIYKNVRIGFNAVDWILKPSLITAFAGFLMNRSYQYIQGQVSMEPRLLLLSFCLILVAIYTILLFITRAISRDEFKR
ncbi:MAG TPA: polysaccharide biosynthesis protein [Lachnospiraceae bacterium]|nr:polysaccharide biosynthesis protein [Lachnospiraceae bacterium]